MKKIVVILGLFILILHAISSVSEAAKNVICVVGMIVSGLSTLVVLRNAYYRK